jgi:nucleotide-binding universal stress UspA family protein
MLKTKRILVAVDGSASSRRTVAYAAEMFAGNPEFHVGLIHLELPPRMLEWGGSEDVEIEDEVSSERATAYAVMEKNAIKEGRGLLQKLQGILAERKIDVAAQLIEFEEPLDAKSIANHIVETAREGDYGTVVVGQHTFSGLKRLIGHHVGEQLVGNGKEVTIWVVAS